MKKIWILVLIMAACKREQAYNVESHLSDTQKTELMNKIIRYVARAPEGLTFEERFYPAYDTFYLKQAALHKFEAYYINGNEHYFLVSRRAPSLADKRVATGGRFTLKSNEINAYEEVFRTWKMVPDTLQKRGLFLFEKMVQGESLVAYQTKNSNGTEYIEFPDDITYYDKTARRWRTKTGQGFLY